MKISVSFVVKVSVVPVHAINEHGRLTLALDGGEVHVVDV
jgi:hypothetical protein